MSPKIQLLPLLAMITAVACSDAGPTSAPRTVEPTAAPADRIRTPDKYVAIGTSISMGWASNGVYAGSQLTSWPALIGFGTLQPISLPLIESPGCISPIVAPLGAGLRLSGESISGSTTCANNVQGVTLPTQNVALAGALAMDAVLSTPVSKGLSAPFYFRVLPPTMTQLTAANSQQPTILSIELGGNEILNATGGLYAPGVTVVPMQGFTPYYGALLDGLTSHPKVVLVGLPREARNLPALRKGSEIWNDRAEFAALHVDVSTDCRENGNYINVSLQSLNMVFTGAFTSSHGLPNPVYSCTDVPGTLDNILTPADIVLINTQLGQMSDYISGQAKARGYAYFSLGALYDRENLKGGAYSVIAQMTSKTPYGAFVSLDGVHPNALGSAVLAVAGALAYNQKYSGHDVEGRGATANLIASSPALSLGDQFEEQELPAMALEQARQIAAANAGRKLTGCVMPTRALSGC